MPVVSKEEREKAQKNKSNHLKEEEDEETRRHFQALQSMLIFTISIFPFS